VVLLPPLGTRLAAVLAEAGVPVGALDARASEAGDLAEAVGRAHALTPPGGSVVLSPAAPSFGAFRDHVERAERFHAEVERLADRLGTTLVAPDRPAG